MRTGLSILIAALALAGCGGNGDKGRIIGKQPCPPVPVAERGQKAKITDIRFRNTTCRVAQSVVEPWVKQQLEGHDKAELPTGWRCDQSSICRKGDAKATFAIDYEGGDD